LYLKLFHVSCVLLFIIAAAFNFTMNKFGPAFMSFAVGFYYFNRVMSSAKVVKDE